MCSLVDRMLKCLVLYVMIVAVQATRVVDNVLFPIQPGSYRQIRFTIESEGVSFIHPDKLSLQQQLSKQQLPVEKVEWTETSCLVVFKDTTQLENMTSVFLSLMQVPDQAKEIQAKISRDEKDMSPAVTISLTKNNTSTDDSMKSLFQQMAQSQSIHLSPQDAKKIADLVGSFAEEPQAPSATAKSRSPYPHATPAPGNAISTTPATGGVPPRAKVQPKAAGATQQHPFPLQLLDRLFDPFKPNILTQKADFTADAPPLFSVVKERLADSVFPGKSWSFLANASELQASFKSTQHQYQTLEATCMAWQKAAQAGLKQKTISSSQLENLEKTQRAFLQAAGIYYSLMHVKLGELRDQHINTIIAASLPDQREKWQALQKNPNAHPKEGMQALLEMAEIEKAEYPNRLPVIQSLVTSMEQAMERDAKAVVLQPRSRL